MCAGTVAQKSQTQLNAPNVPADVIVNRFVFHSFARHEIAAFVLIAEYCSEKPRFPPEHSRDDAIRMTLPLPERRGTGERIRGPLSRGNVGDSATLEKKPVARS